MAGEWMYHPGRRAIVVWLPDLERQSLSYLVTIMAHELGHAMDFDAMPGLPGRLFGASRDAVQERRAEERAFVRGFLILQECGIPVSLRQYVAMIEEPMARRVERLLRRRVCSLLDATGAAASRAPHSALPVA